MTPRPAVQCAHELRPGTTVCLYCRAEERAVRLRRRQRSTLRLLGGVAGAAVVVATVVGAFSLLRRDGTAGDAVAASTTAARAVPAASERASGAQVSTSAAAMPATSAPAIPAGRTALTGEIFADRVADTVVVHFDTRDARTRRSDKFEAVVRQTLPGVIGAAGAQALARVEPGTLVPAGRLLESLAAGPLRLAVGDGRVILLTPGSRMGQDGPLVVRYRAVIEQGTTPPTS